MFSHLVLNRAAFPAHEGKVQHRIADFAKIKVGIDLLKLVSRAWLISRVSAQAELDVDDFLAPDDPRIMSEGKLPNL